MSLPYDKHIGASGASAHPVLPVIVLPAKPMLWVHLLTKINGVVHTIKFAPHTFEVSGYSINDELNTKTPLKCLVDEEWQRIPLEERCELLLTGHPYIKITIENNKIKLSLDKNNPSEIFARIYIKGETSIILNNGEVVNRKYRVRFFPHHLEKCFADVKLTAQRKYVRVRLDISRLATYSHKQLSKFLINIHESLNVRRQGRWSDTIIKIFPTLSPSFNIPDSAALARMITLATMTNKSSVFQKTAQEMMKTHNFIKTHFLELADISIATTPEHINPFITELLTELGNPFRMHDTGVAIAQVLSKLVSNNTRKIDDKHSEQKFIDRLKNNTRLSVTDLIRMVDAVISKLKAVKEESDKSFALNYFLALEALLEALVHSNASNMPHEKHKEFYDIVKDYEKATDFRIYFLARYCKLLLRLISTTKSSTDLSREASKEIFEGYIEIIDSIHLDAPWGAIKGIRKAVPHFAKAYQSLKEARRIIKGKELAKAKNPQDWFHTTFCWRKIISSVPRPCLQALVKEHPIEEPQRSLYLIGMLRLLEMMLEQQDLNAYAGYEVVRKLEILWRANDDGSPKETLGRVDEQYRASFENYAHSLLQRATAHAIPEIKNTAIAILGTMSSISSSQSTFNSLLTQVLREHEPKEWKIQRLQFDYLNDSTFVSEQSLYSSIAGRMNTTKSAKLLEEHIEDFLSGPEKVLLIKGKRGQGKSLATKIYTWMALQSYNPDNPEDYLVLHIPLSKISQFDTEMIPQYLRKIDMMCEGDDLHELKEEKIFVVADGFDEAEWGLESEEIDNTLYNLPNLRNLYDSNEFGKWKNLKIMFTCRSDLCPIDLFRPKNGSGLKIIDIVERVDNEDTPLEYFTKYTREISKKGKSPCFSSAENYNTVLDAIHHLNKQPFETILNDRTLRKAIACSLPGIIEEVAKHKATQDVFGKQLTSEELLNELKNWETQPGLKPITHLIRERMFDVFICINGRRQDGKKAVARKNSAVVSASQCINYSLEMAIILQQQQTVTAKWIQEKVNGTDEAYKKLRHLIGSGTTFDPLKEFLLRSSCLVSDEAEQWKFVDGAYHEHLIDLAKDIPRRDALSFLLKDGHKYRLMDEDFNQ